jgi:hypothetical protein
MQLVNLATALLVAAISVTSTNGADVSVVGSWTSANGDVAVVGVHSTAAAATATPDINVIGSHTTTDGSGDVDGDGAVSVVGVWTRPASDE